MHFLFVQIVMSQYAIFIEDFDFNQYLILEQLMHRNNALMNPNPKKKSFGKPERRKSEPKLHPRLSTQSRNSSAARQRIRQNPFDPSPLRLQYEDKPEEKKFINKKYNNWTSHHSNSTSESYTQPDPRQQFMMQETRKLTPTELYQRHRQIFQWAVKNRDKGVDIENQLILMKKYYEQARHQLQTRIKMQRLPSKRQKNEAKKQRIVKELQTTKKIHAQVAQNARQARKRYEGFLQSKEPQIEEWRTIKEQYHQSQRDLFSRVKELESQLQRVEAQIQDQQEKLVKEHENPIYELEKLDNQQKVITRMQRIFENDVQLQLRKIERKKQQLAVWKKQYKRVEDRLKYSKTRKLPAEEVERLEDSKKRLLEDINLAQLDLAELQPKKKR